MLDGHDSADEERVVAGLVLVDDPGLDPAEGAVEKRAARRALPPLDAVPVSERRDAAGEMLGHGLLIAGKEAERETARVSQQLVHGRLPAHRDADEGRLERERERRPDGQPEPLAPVVHGQHGDAGRKAAQKRAKFVSDSRQGRRRLHPLGVDARLSLVPHIKQIEVGEAEGQLAEEYAAALGRAGKVFNIVKAMCLNPLVLNRSMALYQAIMFGPSELSRAERELLAVVVSTANDCHY